MMNYLQLVEGIFDFNFLEGGKTGQFFSQTRFESHQLTIIQWKFTFFWHVRGALKSAGGCMRFDVKQ